MKIKKYAGGGLPTLVSFNPVQNAYLPYQNFAQLVASIGAAESSESSGKSGSKSSSKSDKNIGLLTEKMQDMIMKNALPSDAQVFMKNIDVFGANIDPLDPTSQNQIYQQILSTIPELQQNKEEYDKAIQHATSKGTIKEYAFSSNGGIYVFTKDKEIKIKDPFELAEGDQRLTNGDLMQLRAYSPDYAFDKGNFSTIIAGSLSRKDLTDKINAVLNNIGKATTSDEFFIRKGSNDEKLAKGYEQLIEQGEDGVYKVTRENINQNESAKYLLNYIISELTPQEKGMLNDMAAQSGLDKQTGAIKIVTDLVQGKLDVTDKTKISFDNQATKGATDDKGNKLGNIKVTGLYEYQTGEGGQNEQVQLIPGGKYSMSVEGKYYGQPLGANGEPIPASSLESFFSQGFGTIGDIRNGVYFGNQKIDPSQYDQIMYDGTQLTRAWLPYTIDSEGTVHPDFSLLKAYEAIQDQLDKASTPQQKIAILRENGFEDYMKEDGNWNRQKMMPFLMTKAYGSGSTGFFGGKSGVVDEGAIFVDDEQYLVKVPETRRKQAQATMIRTLSSKDHPVSVEDNIYQGLIFIPVLNASDLAMTVSGSNPVISQGENLGINDLRYIDQNKISSNFVSASSTKL